MNIPDQERLRKSEQAIDRGWSAIKTAGHVVLAGIEGAIDGAIEKTSNEISLTRDECTTLANGIIQLEIHANNDQAHKDI